MASPIRSSGDLTGKITIAAVVAAIACCGIPLLIAAGVVTARRRAQPTIAHLADVAADPATSPSRAT